MSLQGRSQNQFNSLGVGSSSNQGANMDASWSQQQSLTSQAPIYLYHARYVAKGVPPPKCSHTLNTHFPLTEVPPKILYRIPEIPRTQ